MSQGGELTRNPAARIGVPWHIATPDRKREAEAWNEDQVQQFLAAIDDHRWASPIRLCGLYGLRRREVLAVRWSGVDLKKGTVRVEQALVEVHGRPELTPARTPAHEARSRSTRR